MRRLADPAQRTELLRRYAEFHLSAEEALVPHLSQVPGLDFEIRSRRPLLARFAEPPLSPFPQPNSVAEALGMMYVLEGSTLGGKMMKRMLAERCGDDDDLAFLDPYGKETGVRWRAFVDVLVRETAGGDARMAQACDGARAAFSQANKVLCGPAG